MLEKFSVYSGVFSMRLFHAISNKNPYIHDSILVLKIITCMV